MDYNIYKNRSWFDIVQDGELGEAGRVKVNFDNLISLDKTILNYRIVLTSFYFDIDRNIIRRSYGRDPEISFQDLASVSSPITNLIGYTYKDNVNNFFVYFTDDNNNFNSINNVYGNTVTALTDINPILNNIKLKKIDGNSTTICLLSINNSIYKIENGNNFFELVSNYNGKDFSGYIDDINQEWYLNYTSNQNVKVIKYKLLNYKIFGSVSIGNESGINNNCAYLSNDITLAPVNYLKINNIQNVPLSISFWFKTTTLANPQTIISLTDNLLSDPSIQIDIATDGNLSAYIALPSRWGSITTTTSPIIVGNWHHVCLTINQNFLTNLYIDNVNIGSYQGNNSFGYSFNNFLLGGSGDNSRAFDGYIDEFNVYNKELDSADINSLFNLNQIYSGRIINCPFEKEIRYFDIIGNITYSPGKIGNCAYFNNNESIGAQNYIIAPNFNNVPMSISFWFKVDSLNFYKTILSLTDIALTDPSIQFDLTYDGNLNVAVALPAQWQAVTTNNNPISAGVWYHVCLTIDNSYLTSVYLDNVLIGTCQGTDGFGHGQRTFIIGGSGLSNNSFKGYIDEFYVYNRALSSSEVQDLYNLNKIDTGLINYLDLELNSINYPLQNVGSLYDYYNKYSLPRIININNNNNFFIKDTKDNFIYSTNITSNVIKIDKKLRKSTDYKLMNINDGIYIYNNDDNNKLSQLKIYNNVVQIEANINVKDQNVKNNAFDITNINNEQYVYYINSSNKLRQIWNPIQTIIIKINSTITTLTGNVTNYGSLYPAFDTSITDYAINTDVITTGVNYNFVINGTINISEYCYPNQLIKLIDDQNKKYYIKILPWNVLLASTVKYPNYQTGFYLTADTFGVASPYYTVHDSNGVPIWYKRNTSDPNYSNNPMVCSAWKGNTNNRIVTCNFGAYNVRSIYDVFTDDVKHYYILPDNRLGSPTWDVHEVQELKAPPSRKNNIFLTSYWYGFYLQELNPNNEKIWEWWSIDYLYSQYDEFYHINSADVHPVSGHVVVSLRNCSSVVSIDYVTKAIRWVIDPTTAFTSQLIDSSGVHILTPTNEPSFPNLFNGTSAQHDARWHTNITPLTSGNEIVTIYDNGSFNGFYARGVIYEIDLVNDQAIFRGMVYGPGSSGYMGSYKIIEENNGTNTHVLDWVQMHPCMVEYEGDNDKMPTQTALFSLDLPGDHYRFDKAKLTDLSMDGMRRTSGMPFSTP